MRMRKASCRECSISKRKAMHTHTFSRTTAIHTLSIVPTDLCSQISQAAARLSISKRHNLLPNRLEAQHPREEVILRVERILYVLRLAEPVLLALINLDRAWKALTKQGLVHKVA